MGRIVDQEEAVRVREELRAEGRRVVFTNGCFDLLHRGHVDLLAAARARGDCLMVGLNDDASVRRLKGQNRPWVPAEDRAAILAALTAVDLVILFPEDTPQELIGTLLPDVLVKGGDYRPEEVVGKEEVEATGGEVAILPLSEGRSTTGLIRSIRGGGRPRSGGGLC